MQLGKTLAWKLPLQAIEQRQRALELGQLLGSRLPECQQADQQELEHLLVDQAWIGAPRLRHQPQRRVDPRQMAGLVQPSRQLERVGGCDLGHRRSESNTQEWPQLRARERVVELAL